VPKGISYETPTGALKSREWTSRYQVAGVDITGVDIEGVAKQQ